VPGRFRQRAVVLLVEDNPDDVVMIREAFEQSLTPVQLYVVSNGERAIKFVRRTDADAPRPSLIMLDRQPRRGAARAGGTLRLSGRSQPKWPTMPSRVPF